MTAIPDKSLLDSEVRTGSAKTQVIGPIFDVLAESLGGAAVSELTISAGSITPTGASHTVDTGGDAETDDLTNIAYTNHPDGRIVILSCADDLRGVVLKHGAGGDGQLLLRGGVDLTLSDIDDTVFLQRRGTTWVEIIRSMDGTTSIIDGMDAAAARTALGLAIGADVLSPTGDGSGLTGITSTPNKNILDNAAGQINQLSVSGTVTLSAGETGHDRWVAGASGCTYTFSTTNNITTFTISAGSLIQVVRSERIKPGDHSLSWSGTSQGRFDSDSYADSSITKNLAGSADITVEFDTGTLSQPKLEIGDTNTAFEIPPTGDLEECRKYIQLRGRGLFGNVQTASNAQLAGEFTPHMHGVPTITLNQSSVTIQATAAATASPATLGTVSITETGFWARVTGFSGLTPGQGILGVTDDIFLFQV